MSQTRRGVTLLEMLIVTVLIGLLVSISFPSVSAGVDTLRLSSAGQSVASLLNSALNRTERTEQPVELTIDQEQNILLARSAEPGFERRLELQDGVRIAGVLPALSGEASGPRRFILYPGGTAPRIGVDLANRRGAHSIVSIDPITGVPSVERVRTP